MYLAKYWSSSEKITIMELVSFFVCIVYICQNDVTVCFESTLIKDVLGAVMLHLSQHVRKASATDVRFQLVV